MSDLLRHTPDNRIGKGLRMLIPAAVLLLGMAGHRDNPTAADASQASLPLIGQPLNPDNAYAADLFPGQASFLLNQQANLFDVTHGGGDEIIYDAYVPQPPAGDKILSGGSDSADVYLTTTSAEMNQAETDYVSAHNLGGPTSDARLRVLGLDLPKSLVVKTKDGKYISEKDTEREAFVVNVTDQKNGTGPNSRVLNFGQLLDKTGPHFRYGAAPEQDVKFPQAVTDALMQTPFDGYLIDGVASLGNMQKSGIIDANANKETVSHLGKLHIPDGKGGLKIDDSAGNLIDLNHLHLGKADPITGYVGVKEIQDYLTKMGIDPREQVSQPFGIKFSIDGKNTTDVIIQVHAGGAVVYLPGFPDGFKVQTVRAGALRQEIMKKAADIQKQQAGASATQTAVAEQPPAATPTTVPAPEATRPPVSEHGKLYVDPIPGVAHFEGFDAKLTGNEDPIADPGKLGLALLKALDRQFNPNANPQDLINSQINAAGMGRFTISTFEPNGAYYQIPNSPGRISFLNRIDGKTIDLNKPVQYRQTIAWDDPKAMLVDNIATYVDIAADGTLSINLQKDSVPWNAGNLELMTQRIFTMLGEIKEAQIPEDPRSPFIGIVAHEMRYDNSVIKYQDVQGTFR